MDGNVSLGTHDSMQVWNEVQKMDITQIFSLGLKCWSKENEESGSVQMAEETPLLDQQREVDLDISSEENDDRFSEGMHKEQPKSGEQSILGDMEDEGNNFMVQRNREKWQLFKSFQDQLKQRF